MGNGYGPIIVRKRPTPNSQLRKDSRAGGTTSNEDGAVREFLIGKKIAVPGTMTSAFLALQLFLGEFDYLVVPFDKIFDALRSGQADLGHRDGRTHLRPGRRLHLRLAGPAGWPGRPRQRRANFQPAAAS